MHCFTNLTAEKLTEHDRRTKLTIQKLKSVKFSTLILEKPK